MKCLSISRKHGKIEYTFFPVIVAVAQLSEEWLTFYRVQWSKNSSDFKYKSRECISLCCSHLKFDKHTCSVYNG
jgi:hypothetical protein